MRDETQKILKQIVEALLVRVPEWEEWISFKVNYIGQDNGEEIPQLIYSLREDCTELLKEKILEIITRRAGQLNIPMVGNTK